MKTFVEKPFLIKTILGHPYLSLHQHMKIVAANRRNLELYPMLLLHDKLKVPQADLSLPLHLQDGALPVCQYHALEACIT